MMHSTPSTPSHSVHGAGGDPYYPTEYYNNINHHNGGGNHRHHHSNANIHSIEGGGGGGGGIATRQRIGGDLPPYRDDPNAPPSVRLESFTRGGLGPLHATPIAHNKNNGNHYASDEDNDDDDDHHDEKSKWKQSSFSYYSRYIYIQISSCSQSCYRTCCQTIYESDEEYDRNLYYLDTFNDMSWSCSIGTTDEHGIWLNQSDPAGTIMALLVWVLLLYSTVTISFLAETGGIPINLAMCYTILAGMALACHAKTQLTDPGSVPPSAVPTELQRYTYPKLSMCSQCQTYKPPLSHHCRICNRCISRMDHHCPWMNNCVGAGNLKHFTLFLLYTWTCSVFLLLLLGYNYFFCADETCVFTMVLTQLVRLMTVLSVGAFLFTSSMLMNVVYGILTGIGTIDRLKKKAIGTINDSEEECIPLKDIFGIGPFWTWILPIDPIFPDYDRVMGYSTPQRLLREQMRFDQQQQGDNDGSVVSMATNTPTPRSIYRDTFGIPI